MEREPKKLASAAASWERRLFLLVLGSINLAFLAVDLSLGLPHLWAVVTGRVLLSAVLLGMSLLLGRIESPERARAALVAASVASTGAFALLAWGAGGAAGPYLAFLPLLPLVITVAVPDVPLVPLACGVTALVPGIAMEAASGATPGHLALWGLAFGSSTLYGWAGSYLFLRMRLREQAADLERLDARRELEAALARSRESEALYRTMAASFPDGFIGLFGLDMRLLLVDGDVPEGTPSPESLVGKSARDLVPADAAGRVEEMERQALRGVAGSIEYQAGGRHVALSLHPVRDASGQPILGLVIGQDVTLRRALESRLAVSSRLAALGTLVAGLAHAINNPLTGVLSGLSLAGEDVSEVRRALRAGGGEVNEALAARLDETADMLASGMQAAARIARIVRDLALFARPDPAREKVALPEVARAALRWLPASVGASASVRIEDGGAPEVHDSPGQIEQVLVNLISNAAQSIPPGRTGNIEVRLGTSRNGGATVEVSDDGDGIAPEAMERIFDPFFTTRVPGMGTGLGLPICHAIVSAHGGTIAARSAPGAGSVFRIELPAA